MTFLLWIKLHVTAWIKKRKADKSSTDTPNAVDLLTSTIEQQGQEPTLEGDSAFVKKIATLTKAFTIDAMTEDTADRKLNMFVKDGEGHEAAVEEFATTEPLIDVTNDMVDKMDAQLSKGFSRVTDEQAIRKARAIKGGTMAGLITLETLALVAEIASLGQVEGLFPIIQDALSLSGMPDVARELYKIPLYKSCVIPYDQIMNKKFTPYFPSVNELVRMRVREAITEEEFKEALAYQGFSEKWGDAWWWSHWIMPPNRDLFDMKYRGLINEEELKKQLIINDYLPEYVDKYVEISKKLPSRMDLRLMSQRVTLDPEKVTEALKAEGLREDWFEPYETTILHYRLGDLHSRIANTSMRLYKDGMLTSEDFETNLLAAKFSDRERAALRDVGEMNLRTETLQDLRTILVNHFRHERLTLEELHTQLIEAGYTTTKAQLIADIEYSRMKQLPEEPATEEET